MKIIDLLHRISSAQYVLRQVRSESQVKNDFSKLCPPNIFNTTLLHQNECFVNLRTREFMVNKNEEEVWQKEKTEKYDNRIMHISYQLPPFH